jgi:hypothetical protein
MEVRDKRTQEKHMQMRNRTLAGILGAVTLAGGLLTPGAAFAHPVGDDTQANCHGQRVSHGASHSPVHEGHELTPVERRDMIEEFLGEEITMGEWHKFVKTCPPPEPPTT